MKVKTKSGKVNRAWLNDHINDPYVKMAKKDGYRARAAYKLKEIVGASPDSPGLPGGRLGFGTRCLEPVCAQSVLAQNGSGRRCRSRGT